MKSPLYTATVLAGALVLTACHLPRQIAPNPGPANPNLALKRVVDKREPIHLIAFDGSECTVPQSRYKKIKINDNVVCLWQFR